MMPEPLCTFKHEILYTNLNIFNNEEKLSIVCFADFYFRERQCHNNGGLMSTTNNSIFLGTI